MSKNKDNLLTMIDENGNEVICEILFTYHSDEFNKDYVVFFAKGAEDSADETVEVSAACYNPTDENGGNLLPIETDEEWDMIEELLTEYEEDELSADEAEDIN